MSQSIFRAYDIRGVYPREINNEVAYAVGNAVARRLAKRGSRTIIVVGHDARTSSFTLYRAVITGIRNYELGIRRGRGQSKPIIHNSLFIIHRAGLITTPMLYFLVNDLHADGGVMITASHNPKEWNGFKIVKANAAPVSGKNVRQWIT